MFNYDRKSPAYLVWRELKWKPTVNESRGVHYGVDSAHRLDGAAGDIIISQNWKEWKDV